jgi:YVTN family beta-propeller protein
MKRWIWILTSGWVALGACGCSSANDGRAGGHAGARAVTGEQHFYVVNTGSQSISVIDGAQVIDTVEIGAQPHGQGPSSRGDRIYVTTDGDAGEVIAVDARSREILWRIEAGDALNEPHLTRDDRFLYAPDLLAARTVVVDVELGEVAGEIAMQDPADGSDLIGLHNTYASHDGQRMYVTAILSNKIAEISVATRRIERILRLSGQPRPAAISDDDRKMYVQLSELHGFIEVDLGSGVESRRVEWPDDGARPPGFVESVLLTKCHGIAIAPGGELWAASNLQGVVRVYSLPALEELAAIEVGILPNWIAFTRDGSIAYVTNTDPAAATGSVSVIDVESRAVTATLTVGKAPKRIHRVDLVR